MEKKKQTRLLCPWSLLNMEIDIYILKALIMMMFSVWKTYVGPALSYACKFSYSEMLVFNLSAAMMSTFFSLRYSRAISKTLNRLFSRKKKPQFNPKYRKYIRFWNRYGLYGTMLLTPVLIGIPIGIFLAVRFGTRKMTIMYAMAFMVLFWSTIFYYLGMFGFDIIHDSVVKRYMTTSN